MVDTACRIHVDFNRHSPLTAVRAVDIEPFTETWNADIPYTNCASHSHVRLVSFSGLNFLRFLFLNEKVVFSHFLTIF